MSQLTIPGSEFSISLLLFLWLDKNKKPQSQLEASIKVRFLGLGVLAFSVMPEWRSWKSRYVWVSNAVIQHRAQKWLRQDTCVVYDFVLNAFNTACAGWPDISSVIHHMSHYISRKLKNIIRYHATRYRGGYRGDPANSVILHSLWLWSRPLPSASRNARKYQGYLSVYIIATHENFSVVAL